MKSLEDLAIEYATHKIECTCKGSSFEQKKYDGFVAGHESRNTEVGKLMLENFTLKRELEKMVAARADVQKDIVAIAIRMNLQNFVGFQQCSTKAEGDPK